VSQLNRFSKALVKSPILWGAAASVGFFAMVDRGMLGPKFFPRYCAGHPVEYVETILFFVGLAALAVKALEVSAQRMALGKPLLGPIPRDGQSPSDCPALLARLASLPRSWQGHYLVRRLRSGLEYVGRRDSAESLDEQLKHLADLDADRVHGSYGLLRLIVWAIPILGFLGTVIGITMAIASLRVDALEESMVEVTAGLGVAFDTTALALALSIILMFTQHYVDRAEGSLLAEVDRRVDAELSGRFAAVSSAPDGQMAAFRRMTETMVRSLDDLMRRQAEQWRASVEAAGQRWTQTADAVGRQLQASLAGALAESLKAHARQVASAEEAAAEKNRRHWGEVQRTLSRAAETLAATQVALVDKAEVLGRAVEGTAYVAKLEETLNHNLAALAGAKNFEDTVMSLAAVIHLLNTRLAGSPAAPATPGIQLDSHRRTGRAA
jgi:hypothetical protein